MTVGKKMTGKGFPAVRKELFALGGSGLRLRKMASFFFILLCVGYRDELRWLGPEK